MGRDTRGVKGIELEDGQKVISLMVPSPDDEILTVSKMALEKNQKLMILENKERSKEVIAIQLSDRNGKFFSCSSCEEDEVILIRIRNFS